MTKQDKLKAAFMRGRDARQDGKHLTTCPYQEQPPSEKPSFQNELRDAWFKGWACHLYKNTGGNE